MRQFIEMFMACVGAAWLMYAALSFVLGLLDASKAHGNAQRGWSIQKRGSDKDGGSFE